MSFICENCLRDKNPRLAFWGVSHGRCEDCDVVALCADIASRYLLTPEQSAEVDRMVLKVAEDLA